MQDKKSFGKYITEKRKEAKLTQEELAKELYVIPTTISKWERGITYPDITMITKLCSILNISEHEFFMACDDESLNEEKMEIRKYQTIKKLSIYFLNISYIIALFVCLLCNLIIDHKLSWFLIVLVGIMISFVITTLPFYLEKNKYRLFKISLLFIFLVYLLLYVVNYVNKGTWLLDSFKIATFVFIWLWIDVLVITFVKIHKYFKIGISLILIAIISAFTNPFCNKVLNIQNRGSNLPNIISAVVFIFISLFFFIKGFRKTND